MPFATPYHLPLRKLEMEDDPDRTPTQTPRRMPPVPALKPLDDDDEDIRPHPDVRPMVALGMHAELRAPSHAIRNRHHEGYAFDNEPLDARVAWEEEAYKEYCGMSVYREADAVDGWREAQRMKKKEEERMKEEEEKTKQASGSPAGWLTTEALLGLSVACLSIALMLWMILWMTAYKHHACTRPLHIAVYLV
ncbi:hypothetical protein TEQG_07712 [Trichophyton equinum CBS 127.97]|uniref:Uncharacterized protein n=1 Tax=Trichophyton equinum (strain ATCC MYA-4606 / CBS 127.97) TaxID=559882 RepID=F2Q3N7_TRIEC|nr:hypothetical protein TEQG_07712 [Trichophyton equinum CBS 127.97]